MASATTASSWRVTTATTSGGSSGHGDDASEEMKVGGSAERMRASSDAVVRRSGGVASIWPHTVHIACMYSCVAGGACSVTFTDVGVDVPPAALPSTTNNQASAASRELRTVEFTTPNSQVAVAAVSLLLVAGALTVAIKPSGSGVYASMMAGGVVHASVNCTAEVASDGRRTRSPVGTQMHSAYTASAWPRRAADAVNPANIMPAAVPLIRATVPEVDDSTSRDDTRSSDWLSGGVEVVGSNSAIHDSDVKLVTVSTPPLPTKLNTAVSSGSASGTTTNGAGGKPLAFQSARQLANTTAGLGCPAVDAVRPTASTHVAVSDPVQPDAPLASNASRCRSDGTASGVPLAPTDSNVADDTVMLAGRAASAGLDVAHEVTLIVRLQVAASRDKTRSVGADDNSPLGSAASVGVAAHDTAKVAGYVRLTSSVEAAPAALNTTTDTIG